MLASLFIDVIGATASILMIGGSGVYLSSRGMLNAERLKYLSSLVEMLFTPCLIFSSFVKTLDLRLIDEWLVPMLISCLSILQGMILGYFLNKYILKDKQFEAIIILGCGIAMTTNMQLNLSTSLSDYLDSISLAKGYVSPYSGKQRAVKYVMIYTFVNTIMRWTLAKQVLITLKNAYERAQSQNQLNSGMIPLIQISPSLRDSKTEEAEKQKEEAGNKKEQSVLYNLLHNPPIQASLLSGVVCAIPSLREALIQEGSFLNRSVYLTTQSIGGVILPLVLITLGGNLYLCVQERNKNSNSNNNNTSTAAIGVSYTSSQGDDQISIKSLVGITLGRLVFMPIIGYVTLLILNYYGLCDDPVLQFIVIVSDSVPSAINLLIISTLYFPKSAKQLSKVLLCGYSANIITLPIIIILFLSTFQY